MNQSANKRSAQQLRGDALAIWQAAVAAVDSRRLVSENLRVEDGQLIVGELAFALDEVGRIAVVGAGKAGAGMAAGVEEALGSEWMKKKQLTGWVNVPADCARALQRITLHPARPAGVNEPTEAGAAGARRILDLVSSLASNDLCICLISGGGSALLPAPVEGVSLADKQAVTRHLSGAGANIEQLNTVRKQLSRIKGGGLARACRGRNLIALVISDVLGDPLDIIASGPTVSDPASPQDALAVWEQFGATPAGVAPAALRYLEQAARRSQPAQEAIPCRVTNLVIGNNALAVDAAGIEAERRGYSHAMNSATRSEGPAEEVGRHLATMAMRMRDQSGPDCLISGGEPVVELVAEDQRGRGGRNQQLVLAAYIELCRQNTSVDGSISRQNPASGMVLLSGGTDGEDGPTDAAGALFDEQIAAAAASQKIDPQPFLNRNDAYHFFEPFDGLIKTGPTHTNVCDVRVVVVDRIEDRHPH